MDKVLIRADGGKKIGLGHIMRTLVLAKELKKYFEVCYICKDNEEYLSGISKVESEGFKVFRISEDNLVNEIKITQLKVKAKILITDSYDVNEEYFNDIKKIFEVSGYIDDTNICKLNVDFIINQNINAHSFNYETNKDTKLYLGTSYCLLRDEFRIKKDKIIEDKVENILITVGGSDKEYNTLKLIKSIENIDAIAHVVIGSAFEENFVKKLYEKYGSNHKVKLYKNARMAQLMELCDIAISSSGSTLYELSAMQVPTIGIVVADNQKDICKTFNEKGIILGTNDLIYRDINKFNEVIDMLVSSKEKRITLSNNQKNLVNVNGVELLVSSIISNL